MQKAKNCAIISIIGGDSAILRGEKVMFQVGDKVVYGMHGVCVIAGTECRRVDKKNMEYLVLEPVGQDGARFLVPVQNAAVLKKLHPILAKEDLEVLLRSGEAHTDCWIKDENQRKQAYRDLIANGSRERLLQMVYTLYRHKASQSAAGRKCHLCDENFLHDAEKRIAGEIAEVLSLDETQAKAYLREAYKKDA